MNSSIESSRRPINTSFPSQKERRGRDSRVAMSQRRGYAGTVSTEVPEHERDYSTAIFVANLGTPFKELQDPQYDLRHLCGTGRGLELTLPGDLFVATSVDDSQTRPVLKTIADSYSSIGIRVANQFEMVPSVDEWLADTSIAESTALAHFWTAEFLQKFGTHPDAVQDLARIGSNNIHIHTKHGFQMTIEALGLPTPPTDYYVPGREAVKKFVKRTKKKFSEAERVVVNGCYDSSGIGMSVIPVDELASHLETRDELTQVQIYVDNVAHSPCYLATLTDFGAHIIDVSLQRLKGDVEHAGNLWTANLLGKLETQFPNSTATVLEAFKGLWKLGVRGPINIDALLTTDGRTYLREANVRNAGSQPIVRMRGGLINEDPITQILLKREMPMPLEEVADANFLQKLNKDNAPGTATTLYRYNLIDQRAGLAVLGTDEVNIDQLKAQEDKITSLVSSQ